MPEKKLYHIVHILLFYILFFGGLYYAKAFLMPAAFALLFSMLLLPKVVWLENKGVPKGLAILLCILFVVAIFAGVISMIGWQLSTLSEEISQVSTAVDKGIDYIKDFIRETIGLSRRETNKLVDGQQNETTQKAPKVVANILFVLTSLFTNIILTIVYIFMFLYMRSHFKTFVLKLVKPEHKEQTLTVIRDSVTVARGYLSGLTKMISCIIILYMVGLTIVGVKHPILFAILTGTLEVVPFIGNITGSLLTIIMAIVQDNSSPGIIIGVLVVFTTVQFIQAYILEPLIVGSEINLNPFFTIIALVLGQIVWGIPGMILALPMLGIIKIVCDNIEQLKPYGFLFGSEKKKKTRTLSIIEKIKSKIK